LCLRVACGRAHARSACLCRRARFRWVWRKPWRIQVRCHFSQTAADCHRGHEEREPPGGCDTAHKGEGVLYFSRLVSKLTQSHLPKIVAISAYQSMTIRNWNTTTKLLALMEHSNKDYLRTTIQS